MSNLTVSAFVDSFMRAANLAAAQLTLGIGVLPTWTWVAGGGAPSDGQFTTNATTPGGTNTVNLHFGSNQGGNTGEAYKNLPPNACFLMLVSLTDQIQQSLSVIAISVSGSVVTFSVGNLAATADPWAGDYVILAMPLVLALPLPSLTINNFATFIGNTTVPDPGLTPNDGDRIIYRFQMDGTGGYTISYNAIFDFGTDITAALDPSAANSKWERVFEWNAADSKWRAVAVARGF